MTKRLILSCLATAAIACAQYTPPPPSYTVVQHVTLFGPDTTTSYYRSGGKVAMDIVHPGTHVRSIIDLGHNLGLRVVGEGVETDDVLTTLRESGCDVAQGFLLARPQPATALRGYLAPTLDPARSRPGARRFSCAPTANCANCP